MPHRALGRNHRQHIGIGQASSASTMAGRMPEWPRARLTALVGQDEAHHAVGQRIARAHAVRQHQVALQLGQAVVGNLGAGQLAKAGVDAVDHLVFVHDALHHGLGGLHARQRAAVELQVTPPAWMRRSSARVTAPGTRLMAAGDEEAKDVEVVISLILYIQVSISEKN